MKTVIVQADGIASDALPELDGQTLLQVAKTPNLDNVATQGEFGYLTLSTKGLLFSSAVTHLALLGYDPQKYYSGLGPFEAASLEVVLEKQDMAFCCQLVTLISDNGLEDTKKIGSHTILDEEEAEDIDSEDARELIDAVNEQLGSEMIQFYAGERCRHLMVWIGGTTRCVCHSPREAKGRNIAAFLPSGNGADVIKELMEASRILLRHHPVNQDREQAGMKPVNCLWLWGPGKAIELPKWKERWSIPSVTISPSGVHRGIGICAGIDVLNPNDQTEEHQAEFSLQVQTCLSALQSKDFVYLHVPIPFTDRTTDTQAAVKAIETFDEQVVGSLLTSASERGDCRLVVVGNHADEETRGPTSLPSPYAFLEMRDLQNTSSRISFNEISAMKSMARDATKLTARVLAKDAS